MIPLFTTQQMREADAYSIDQVGIPATVLMEHAALGLFKGLRRRFGAHLVRTRGVILAGKGNNGGDGLALARLLHQEGMTGLSVCAVGDPGSAENKLQRRILSQLSIPVLDTLDPELLPSCDWVVDALLGTGIRSEVKGKTRQWIEAINAVADRKWVLAADVPSGLDADTGRPQGVAVQACETVTLGFVKRGLVTGVAANFVGRLSLAPIQIPRDIPGISPSAWLWTRGPLPSRPAASHKGDFGVVSVVAGVPQTEGAAVLSAWGALRMGAGRVAVVGSPSTLEAIRPRLAPEVMTWEKPQGVVVVGPGLGDQAAHWVPALWNANAPLVLDADALNFLAQHKEGNPRTAPTVLTPHPKEAARLLGVEVEAVEQDRYGAADQLAEKFQATVVLKGHGTVIAQKGQAPWVVKQGNTVLSKGGSGDLLAGAIGATMAQGMEPRDAAALAVYVEGRAAERLAQKGNNERSPVTREVADEMGSVWREWTDGSDRH